MYIREVKSGKKANNVSYVSHRLVESYQTENGPRQRVVMHLGTLPVLKRDWKILAAILERRLSNQIPIFDSLDPKLTEVADNLMKDFDFSTLKTHPTVELKDKLTFERIDTSSINAGESRRLGAELVACTFWKRLGFENILKICGFTAKQIALSQATIIGRLINPGSELQTFDWFKKISALNELLPEDISDVGKDALYTIADLLMLNHDQIEQALYNNVNKIFPSNARLFLFDLTNAYFEGRCEGNDLAKFGRSKEKRSDCRLVTLALMVDDRGMPIYSKIYGGNQSEPETLGDVLGKIAVQTSIFPECNPIIVMDRGIATIDNVKLILEHEFNYIVIERKASEKDYLDEIKAFPNNFTVIESQSGNKVYLQKLPCDNGGKVLCISEERRKKEQSIDNRREENFLVDINKLSTSVSKGSVTNFEKVARRVGRLQQKYAGIANHYKIILEPSENSQKAVGITFVKATAGEEKLYLNGAYVIETNIEGMTIEDMWHNYHTLSQVEASFKSLKSTLGIRPVYHQTAGRTEGHLFISVLAYYLLAAIEQTLRDNDDHRLWGTIRTALSTHDRHTVTYMDDKNRNHKLRVSGNPENNHREIYKILKVNDPLFRQKKILNFHL